MSENPVNLPFTLYCKNCKSITILILYPGHMLPISDTEKKSCLVCGSNEISLKNKY